MGESALIQQLLIPAAQVLIVVMVVPLIIAYLQLVERKVLGFMQVRLAPRRVGWHGLLQPIADAVKLLIKEDVVPERADRFLFTLAPIVTVMPALAALAVIPIAGRPFTLYGYTIHPWITDVNVALLYLLAISSLGIYGIILGGWASNSKYSLLGALRSSAQMISYEVPLGFALIGVMMLAGSASLVEIVERQKAAGLWYVVPQILGFFCYFISAVAETNRVPFDLPEAEAELVAGFHTEYSGMKFAFFFLAEYTNMIVVSSIVTVLFFGGWLRPFPNVPALDWLENGWLIFVPLVLGAFLGWLADQRLKTGLRGMFAGGALGLAAGVLIAVGDVGGLARLQVPVVSGAFWFTLKVSAFLFLYIWFRGTYPRYRYDQLMRLGWKWLIPLSILNVVGTGLAVLWFGHGPAS
ncbi:MAG TPA: complex I subunit 1 family protein [Candidatus Polarisedimenticolia bacterium]|nr:complex I subunit 1 family protein [Candidatus Polarisedimenticolia bacterium]